MNMSRQPQTDTSRLELRVGGSSQRGAKAENQDAFVAKLAKSHEQLTKGNVVCIADGASCCERAQQASQLSVTTFISDYYSTPESWSVRKSVARVLSSLNAWLNHHGNQVGFGQNRLITTFSAVVFKSNTAYVFHVGDSRVYRLRDNKLQQLTQDHVQYKTSDNSFLTRALGIDSHLKVDVSEYELRRDDKFLLTTDGVHQTLTQEELAEAFTLQSNESLEHRAESLCRQAVKRGSRDNVTCVGVEVCSLPVPDLVEVSRQLTKLVFPPILSEGTKIDEFEIESVLHSGTRSHVYLARSLKSGKPFVLKMPAENYQDDLHYLDSFHREQWAGSRINHSGVIKIYPRSQFQSKSPFLYHVCEYVRGCTLRQWMYDNPGPNFTQVRSLLGEIAGAVRALQRQGMLHRDLKPENIMVTYDRKVKLLDLGSIYYSSMEEMRPVSSDDTPVGAVDYIAPEYLLGKCGTHQSDIFSIGCIIYEMLAGGLPYRAPLIQNSRVASLDNWRYRSISECREDVPQWMDLALKKATEPNIDKRYTAMSEFQADITTPNLQLLSRVKSAPLIERNPLAFWRCLAGALGLLLAAQTVWLYSA